MTPQQINEAIAKEQGWKHSPIHNTWYPPWLHPMSNVLAHTLPNYYNDLNAMHEVEKTLTDEEYQDLFENLYLAACRTTGPEDTYKYKRAWVSATAAQRAEAYLKVKGLWNETIKT